MQLLKIFSFFASLWMLENNNLPLHGKIYHLTSTYLNYKKNPIYIKYQKPFPCINYYPTPSIFLLENCHFSSLYQSWFWNTL